jgi:hypothetical protein
VNGRRTGGTERAAQHGEGHERQEAEQNALVSPPSREGSRGLFPVRECQHAITVGSGFAAPGRFRMKERAMSLEEKLAAVREGSAKRIPPERLAIMHRATEQLRASGILDHVIKPGAKAPDFTLNDQNGAAVTLASLLAAGPVLVSVFRGFW